MKSKITMTVGALALAIGVASGAQAGTLEDVRARGVLNCVINTGLAGFAYPDENGKWKGFDIDFCRATAVAVLGDAQAVKPINATGKTRFTKLNSAEGDVLWRNTTITLSRDVGVEFALPRCQLLRRPGLHGQEGARGVQRDGTGRSLGVRPDRHHHRAQPGRLLPQHRHEVRGGAHRDQRPRPGKTIWPDAVTCTPGMAPASPPPRSTFTEPENHVILPEIISKEPLGPATRQGDDQWSDIVTWVLNATIHRGRNGRHLRECRRHAGKLQGSRGAAAPGSGRQSGVRSSA